MDVRVAERGAEADIALDVAAACDHCLGTGGKPGARVQSCGTCGGRSAAALALDLLFQARARGTMAWFTRVVALAEGEAGQAALREALVADALTVARFRRA